jgi:hypothetical protein
MERQGDIQPHLPRSEHQRRRDTVVLGRNRRRDGAVGMVLRAITGRPALLGRLSIRGIDRPTPGFR